MEWRRFVTYLWNDPHKKTLKKVWLFNKQMN